MIKFLDLYNQDKSLHTRILKDLNKKFKKGDFRKLDNLRGLENDKQTAFRVGKR